MRNRREAQVGARKWVLGWFGAWLVLLAYALSASAMRASEGDGAKRLSLADAVAMALENNESIRIEREAVVAAGAGVEGARGAYDPLLRASGEWRQSSLPVNSAFSGAPAGRLAPTDETAAASLAVASLLPTGGSLELRAATQRGTTDGQFGLLSPAYDSTLGIELRQPLLRDRAIDAARFGVRVAGADHAGAAAELRRQLADTVAEVETAYWALVEAHRATSVREEAVRLASEQLDETGDRISVGDAPETEIAQPRAELERRRGELLAAREAEARATNTLKRLILGADDDATWSRPLVPSEDSEPTVVAVDVASSMRQALAERAEIAVEQATLTRRRAERALAHDAVRPALDAFVSYQRYGLAGSRNSASSSLLGNDVEVPRALEGDWSDSVDQLRGGELDDTRVGLTLSLPIGNRQAQAAVVSARSAEHQAEAELSSLRKQVRAEVLDAAAALDTAGQRIEAARSARAAAEVQLTAERDRYEAGISTNFLVLTRQNDLSRARLDEITAQTDYRRAVTEMARATGGLLERHGIEIDEESNRSGESRRGDQR